MSTSTGYYSQMDQNVRTQSWFTNAREMMKVRSKSSPVAVKAPESEEKPIPVKKDQDLYFVEIWKIIPWAITLFVLLWSIIF